MHSTSSVLRFVIIMTSIVAMLLALLQNGLKSRHDANEAIYSKKATLGAIADHLGLDYSKITDQQVEEIFANSIEQIVIDRDGELYAQDKVESMGYKGGMAADIDMAKEHKKGDARCCHSLYTLKQMERNTISYMLEEKDFGTKYGAV